MTYFLPSNIVTLSNAFDLPEGSITASNYEAALIYYSTSDPNTVLGLDLKICDMQKLLSEVTVLIKI